MFTHPALKTRRLYGNAGSGTAIGVAMIFPFLMMLIVALSLTLDTARLEQQLQSVANSAARIASVCCFDSQEADRVMRVSLTAATSPAAGVNQIRCNSEFVSDSNLVFIDVDGDEVAISQSNPVPAGGTAYVFVTCRVPPDVLGGYLPIFDLTRSAVGVATVDPFRFRQGGS